jgi:hypothetical protein
MAYHTRFPELDYDHFPGKAMEPSRVNAGTSRSERVYRPVPNQPAGEWRFIHTETGAQVGPYYTSKAELLADLERYAQAFGCK